MAGPREDYLKWDDFFSGLTALSAQRSKDPSTQVGACIVDSSNRILSIGYNGFPRGCADSGPNALPWAREGDAALGGLDTKYPFVVHAECNAILNKNSASLEGARMYVGLYPCNECAKMIIQVGIREVVYLSDKYHDAPSFVASRRMFEMSGVTTRQHTPSMEAITLRFAAPQLPPPALREAVPAGPSSGGGGGGGEGGCGEGAAAQPSGSA